MAKLIRSRALAASAEKIARGGTDILAPAEWDRLEGVAHGLWSSMRGMLDAWPLETRSATAIARETGCERTTIQRVIQAAGRAVPDVALLDQVPGPKALRTLLAALRRTSALPRAAVMSLVRSVDQFDLAIRDLGGTQRGLSRRVEASAAGRRMRETDDVNVGDDEMRRMMYRAAEHFLGRSTACLSLVYVATPSETRTDRITYHKALALAGHRARPQSIPLVLDYFGNTDCGDEVSDRVPPPKILDRFTSREVIELGAYGAATEQRYASLRVDLSAIDRAVDFAVLQVQDAPHPTTLAPPVEEFFQLLTVPVEALVFDVFLHRTLASRCLPSADIHLFRPDFTAFPHGRPDTRIQRVPPLVDLGRGLDRASSEFSAHHAAVAAAVFHEAGVDANAYLGFRCQQRYPLWRTGYRMAFDFSTAAFRSGEPSAT